MPQPHNSSAAAAMKSETTEYSPEERQQLLRVAHDVIEAAFEEREVDTTPPSDHLA